MPSSILTSIVFGVPLMSVYLFIWRFSLLIYLILSADFLFDSNNSVCIFLIFVSKYLRCWSFLFLNCFYFEYFLPLNDDFPFSWKIVYCFDLNWAKCFLMSFINTSTPSDDKSTKHIGVRLTHVYLLFFSTK